MIELEKVVKGLEKCSVPECNCGECPYYDPAMATYDVIHCIWSMQKDALALLREQEPRVMTLEELNLDADESVICYSEFCDSRVVNVTAPFRYPGDRLVQLPYIGTEYRNWVDPDQYGVLWRCWTARPTDEQRKAAVWDA